MKKSRWKIFINNFFNLFLLIIVSIILIICILLVRNKLLQNTQALGMALAKSYANEAETNLASFRNMLDLGSEYVDELQDDNSIEEIQPWLQDYFEKISVILGENVVDPYAVIDGQIIAANPWDGDDDYAYQNTMWYQKAVEKEGRTVFTDVYQDAITGQSIITLAKELEKQGDVLVMDIYPNKLNVSYNMKDLPEEGSFYLCDSQGNLIMHHTPWDISEEILQKNTNYLLEGIQTGYLKSYNSSFKDYDGKERGTYYYQMDNGWIAILTIPFESVLMGEKNLVVYILSGMGLFVFIVLFIMSFWNLIQMHKIRTSEKTVQILGDSFYAIYLLDFQKGTYEFIKPSEDVSQEIPMKGTYTALFQVIERYVETEVREKFEYAFSLEKIRERVHNKVTDYGGDYKRRFGNVYKWVNVRTLYNEKIAPNQVIFCFKEVDIEKRQQQQHMEILQDALQTARQSAKDKELFFNSMSHDMRTPLNAIIGFSELVIKSEGDWKKIQDYMNKILHAGKQLLTLINDILELSRIQSGRSGLRNQEFDLKKCIRESMDLFNEQALAQNKQLTEDMQLQNSNVFGDSFKLEQIMNNLLSNAFKYSNAGATIHVNVRQIVSMKRSKYQITVEDTGIGMSEEFLEHIFDPYTRDVSFGTKTVIGTGLGMAIVKSLVQQLSGEIVAESCLGKGSKFTVTIPLEVVEKGSENLVEEKIQNQTTKLNGCRILLAEDNELNMEIAVELLKMNGMEVIPAVNGQEAVQIFKCSDPDYFDAILMDMQMPVMDGCEAARIIRSLDRKDARSVPIIAVTANSFAEDITKTSNAGMNGHISKPIDFKVLVQTLEKMIYK